jgi:hypothetical protein
LSGTDSLKYFWIRFMSETKVPQNRISMGATASGGEGGGAPSSGNWSDGNDGIAREEMRFSYFVNRIRSMFQEILLKPVWIQFVLKHPEFKDDLALKGALGLLFVEENLFTVAKQRQIANSGATIVTSLGNVKQPTIGPDGAATEEPYFDPKFLVEKYMQFSDDDLALNEKYKNQRKNEKVKLANAYARLLATTGTPGVGAVGGGEFGGGSLGGTFDSGTGAVGGADLGGGLGVEAPTEEAPTEESPTEEVGGELGL